MVSSFSNMYVIIMMVCNHLLLRHVSTDSINVYLLLLALRQIFLNSDDIIVYTMQSEIFLLMVLSDFLDICSVISTA